MNAVNYATSKYSQDEGYFITVGAVLRLGPDYYIHENSTHANVGVKSMYVDMEGDVELKFDRPNGSKIVFLSADEDETLCSLGIQAGASGGLGTATIRLYKGTTKVRGDWGGFGEYANIWFMAVLFVPNPVETP